MRTLRRLAVMAAALLLALAVGACAGGSSGSSTGAGSRPEATVEAFMHALGAKDPDTACAQLSFGGQPLSGLALDQCRLGLQKVLAAVQDPGDLGKLRSAKVTGAQVSGDKATVTKAQITGVPSGYQNDVDLVRIEGRWYIDSKSAPAG